MKKDLKMLFDNRHKVTQLNIRRYIALLVYLLGMGMLLLSGVFKEKVAGVDKTYIIIAITLIYILYIIFAYISNYNYFSFNDESEKLVFRFVSLRPFDNEKRAIEIYKKDFHGYKIYKSFFSIRQDLILIIKTKNGIAHYPPISITALDKKQKNLLKAALNRFV